MYISHINLINYRNYVDLDLELHKGLLVFHGNNAQGKTNLLEAIYLLSIAKAYRAKSDREVVNYDTNSQLSQVLAISHRGSDLIRILVNIQLGNPTTLGAKSDLRKDIRVNGQAYLASELGGLISAVLLDSEDIELVLGSPTTRRRYIDILASQMDRNYLKTLQKYHRILYQRNHLLRLVRDGRSKIAEIEFWDQALTEHGTYIIRTRGLIVEEVKELAKEVHHNLTGSDEEIEIDYTPNIYDRIPFEQVRADNIEDTFMKILLETHRKDIAIGSTQHEPHRDDLTLKIEGHDASTYASRGQARTLALALKLGESLLLKKRFTDPPILLLDDIFSELDRPRRTRLLDYVTQNQQVFLSTSDPSNLDEYFLHQSTRYIVENGNIKRL